MPSEKPPPGPLDAKSTPLRTVRSFVPRGGRMTRAQERAWLTLWPSLGLDEAVTPLDLDALFGRRARRTVEIGFGNGEALVALAAARPDEDYLGIEVHRPGVGHLMLRCRELAVANLRIACRDAVEVLQQVPGAGIDEILLYFPDPWPKKRHHKRRIVQDDFVALVANRLRNGGTFRLATDWQPYADWMLDVLARCPELHNESVNGTWVARPTSRPPTRFELRGQRLGHEVRDLAFRRT